MNKHRHKKQKDEPEPNPGWGLIEKYGKDDPVRHLTEIRLPPARVDTHEVPQLLRSEMTTYQSEVVSWLESGIVSWFTFFFALGGRSVQDRLIEASDGLDKSAERLGVIARQIRGLSARAANWVTVDDYASAVGLWSTAMDMIANGTRDDNSRIVGEGLERVELASGTAELVVSVESGPAQFVDLKGALETLESLRPSKRVSASSIRKAKHPWRRSLLAAGSELRWKPRTG